MDMYLHICRCIGMYMYICRCVGVPVYAHVCMYAYVHAVCVRACTHMHKYIIIYLDNNILCKFLNYMLIDKNWTCHMSSTKVYKCIVFHFA